MWKLVKNEPRVLTELWQMAAEDNDTVSIRVLSTCLTDFDGGPMKRDQARVTVA